MQHLHPGFVHLRRHEHNRLLARDADHGRDLGLVLGLVVDHGPAHILVLLRRLDHVVGGEVANLRDRVCSLVALKPALRLLFKTMVVISNVGVGEVNASSCARGTRDREATMGVNLDMFPSAIEPRSVDTSVVLFTDKSTIPFLIT